ncbi:MAG: DinB family protein [Calditrichaeota bacterium]|nr:MAG: DinB family protein [Calditrichota bacterium]
MRNSQTAPSKRAHSLADRILQGAQALEALTKELSDSEWKMPVAGDGRTIGVVVHHVASSYPLEIELAQLLVSGKAISEATMEVVDQINAKHALDYAAVKKQEAIELLQQNSKAASNIVRKLTDAELENAAPVSLNANAPLTAQFFIEDHALRHSFHHLARIRATLKQ